MQKPDISNVDTSNPAEVQQATAELIKFVWTEIMDGMPLAIAANFTAYLNAQLLSQVSNPHQLLYAVEKNSAIMENVISNLADKIGRDEMGKALAEYEFEEVSGEHEIDPDDTGVRH